MSKPITLTARVPLLVVTVAVIMGCNDESLQVSQNQQALTSCVTIRRGAGAVADATIASSAKRQNFGGQSSLKVDKKSEVLLRFELGAIPSSAVVNSALLKLYVPGESGCDHDDDDDDENDQYGHGGHERRGARWHHDNGHHQLATIRIHRAAQAWVESSVTYASFNQRFDPAVAGLLRTSDPRSQKSADVKALVAAWVSGARANQGFLLETSSNRRTVLVSSENPDPALRPVLEVCYTTPDDHCSPNPCQHGAACVNGQSGYTCTCAAGYTGVNCEVNINECAPQNPCQNGGTCADGVGGYTCTCAAGYAGASCQINIDECSPNPCQNSGICTDGVNSHSCACEPGYGGADCEINIDECAGSPCQNGGVCTDGVGSYTCACATGFVGANCEVNIDECAPNPCQNGGTCIDGVASRTCACAPGYTGLNCEVNIDECAPQNPCQNGGVCVDGVFAYSCQCAPGYGGANCQLDINDCSPNPCQNGGTCADGVNSYTCTCPPGYSGTRCETAVFTACSPNPTRVTAGACGKSSTRCWFQTSCAYTGAQIGGLSGADAKCQAHADAAGLGGTYKAWLSSGAVSASARLSQAAVPYVNVNGHVIVANWAELTNDGSLNAPGSGGEPNRLENGTISGGNVWTNTAADGSLSSAANHCDGFTSNAGVAGFGHSDYVDGARYTTFGVQSCAVPSRLYCFEQ